MKTLLQNLKALLEADATLANTVNHFGIGETDVLENLSLRRFPWVVVDRATGIGEEYVPTDTEDLRKRVFHITVKLAVRNRKRETALLGDDGLLTLTDNVLNAIFGDETVGGRVRKLQEEITIDEADVIDPDGTVIGMGRQVNLTYMTLEE
jgi:hypothetical protein